MGVFKKGTKLYSITKLKCPRCHEGDLFETNSFSFQKPFDMPDECPVCKQSFMPEPGFYYGAMFISYIFMGWFSIGLIALLHWVLDWSTAASFAVLIAFYAISLVWIFRTARAIWININVKYRPEYGKEGAKNKG